MKNKFVKILSTGICCIMVTVLMSTYLPQNSEIALLDSQNYKITINKAIDPPFH